MYKPVVPILIDLLKQTTTQIIDLASGGGGGLVKLERTSEKEIPEIKINLSDFYPNIPAFENENKISGYLPIPKKCRCNKCSRRNERRTYTVFVFPSFYAGYGYKNTSKCGDTQRPLPFF